LTVEGSAVSQSPTSKRSEGRVEAALQGLRLGMTRSAAAGAAGVTRVTFYNWLKDEAFAAEVEKAEHEAEASYTRMLAQAAVEGSVPAIQFWLERRRPADYGRRLDVQVGVEVRRVAEEIAARLPEGEGDPELILREAERLASGG